MGVHLARDGDVPTTTPPPNKDTHKLDWLQMADGAMANADLQDSDLCLVLPKTPESIVIDDDDDNKIACPQILPKVEHASATSPSHPITSCYPT